MGVVKMIRKAIRVRRRLFVLAAAKKAAIRQVAELPPEMSLFTAFTVNTFRLGRFLILRPFCPCCFAKYSWKDILCPKTTCCGRLCYEDMYENELLKNFLGFFFGILATWLLYCWFSLQLNYSVLPSAIVCAVLGLILTIGLAFSTTLRCITLLSIPSMFSKQGRRVLIMYATVLVFTYPGPNFHRNLEVMVETITCGQKMIIEEKEELKAMIRNPLEPVTRALKKMIDKMKEFAQEIKKAFQSLGRVIMELGATIHKTWRWLRENLLNCKKELGKPYTKCRKAFRDAYDDCERRLPPVVDLVCHVVNLAANICYICEINKVICLLVALIKEYIIDKIADAIGIRLKDITDMFYFNVTIQTNYTLRVNQSRGYGEIQKAIIANITSKLKAYSRVFEIFNYIMMITAFLIFIKAWLYRRKYLTRDKFDNYYVSPHLNEIDEKRKSLDRDTILPLRLRERTKYLTMLSPLLTESEFKKIWKGIIMWSIGAAVAAFYMAVDVSLWWVLDMIAKHMAFKTTVAIPSFSQLHIEGKGPMADMFRSLIHVIDPVIPGDWNIDTTPCMPKPSKPYFEAYKTIAIIHFICLLLTIFEAYGLRLRHVIAACYYPKRERERAVWLYNHILHTRDSFLKFTRRQIRRKYMNEKELQKMSFRTRLIHQFPLLKRVFKMCGFERKYCLLCGLEGRLDNNEDFKHCPNYNCNGIYCLQCYADLNNVCTVCMSPIDYGDMSDISEEYDSSDDEDIILLKKLRALEQRRKEEAKMKEKKEKNVMLFSKFRDEIDLPTDEGHIQPEEDTASKSEDTLLDSDRSLSGSGESLDTYDSTSEEEKYDTGYQYKSQDDSSTSEDSDLETEQYTPSSTDDVKAKRSKQEYETLDIFNSSSDDFSDNDEMESSWTFVNMRDTEENLARS